MNRESMTMSILAGLGLIAIMTGVVMAQEGAAERGASTRPADRMVTQQRIVASMSGHDPVASVVGVRSSSEQRAAAADWLIEELAAIGLEPQRHDYRLPNVNGLVDLLLPPLRGTNVHAIVEATRPGAPFIVIGAHYDSDPGSPGAGDNAAGVALVHALGQELQALVDRPFNYLLVFFDQEEDDEVGSKAFARFLEAGDLDVHSIHVTDLPGWDDDGDGVVEVQSPTPALERAYRMAAGRRGIPLRITTGGSSDNKSFMAAGFPTVGVFGDVTDHLHQPSDTWETVDFVFLDRVTSLILDVVSEPELHGAR
jgi:hypothetical protein